MIRLSASGVPRGLACAASLVLPQHPYQTKDAVAGTDRHADMEAAIDVGDAADVLPPQVMTLFRPGDRQATECAFAYDCASDTARELGHIKHRAYIGLAPFEIPGTIDLLIMGDGRAIVVDKKGFERVGPAERNEQTLTYALMVARTYGLDEITVVIFYELGGVDIAVIGALDLDAHAQRLKELQFTVARAQSNPDAYMATGTHCKYCPAFLSCPRQSALRLEVASADTVMRIESTIPFHDDKEAADAFDLLGRIKMLTARITSALYARAAERPIPLHNGMMLGTVSEPGNEKLDGDVVYAVIKEKHGQSIADAAVVRSATKKRLKESLAFVGGKSVAAAEREILAEVKRRGGIEQKTKTAIKEYDPAKLLKVVND